MTVIIHFEHINLLGKYWKRIILRMNTDDLDFINLHFHRHQNGDIIKTGYSLGTFVKAEDTNSTFTASSAFSEILWYILAYLWL